MRLYFTTSKQMAQHTMRLKLLRVMIEPNPNPYFCSRCTCYRAVTMKYVVPVREQCRTIPDWDDPVGRVTATKALQVPLQGFAIDC